MANVVNVLGYDVESFEVYPSAARTTTPDTMEFEYPRSTPAKGLLLVIDATAHAATPSLTVKIQGVDRISGAVWDILSDAAITSSPTVSTLEIAPWVTTAANAAQSAILPPVFRIVATHGDADSITYSVSGILQRG